MSKRLLTRKQKDDILERDGYVCTYCQEEATVVDHIIPWIWRHDDSPENLTASCALCNAIANGNLFLSLADKTAYIMERRAKRKRKWRDIGPSICPACGQMFAPMQGKNTSLLCAICAEEDYRDYKARKKQERLALETILQNTA